MTWDSESWKRAARDYHNARRSKRELLQVQREPARLHRLRRLLANTVSLDTTYRELTDPRDRPTPQVVVEAIMFCVRERGAAALKEPENLERLTRCDAAAQAEINRRIAKLKKGGAS